MLGGYRRAAAGSTDTKSRDKDTSLVNDSQSKGEYGLRRLLVRVISPAPVLALKLRHLSSLLHKMMN